MKIYQCTQCGKIFLNEHEADMHSLAFVGHGIWKVLCAIHLPLKAEWYDMIERGEKKEEYRLLSCHWLKHLCYNWQIGERWDECKGGLNCRECLKNEYLAYPFDAGEVVIGNVYATRIGHKAVYNHYLAMVARY